MAHDTKPLMYRTLEEVMTYILDRLGNATLPRSATGITLTYLSGETLEVALIDNSLSFQVNAKVKHVMLEIITNMIQAHCVTNMDYRTWLRNAIKTDWGFDGRYQFRTIELFTKGNDVICAVSNKSTPPLHGVMFNTILKP